LIYEVNAFEQSIRLAGVTTISTESPRKVDIILHGSVN
jgi:hypothetical protein